MDAKYITDYANCGIIGIDEDLNVFGGYDERFEPAGATAKSDEWVEPQHWDEMPKEEKQKLADIMIARWQRYKDTVNSN